MKKLRNVQVRPAAGRVTTAWVILAALSVSTAVAATFRGPSPPNMFRERWWQQLSNTNISANGRAVLTIYSPQWRHGETEHFILHYGRNGDKIAQRAEEFYAEIREFFGNRPDLLAGRKSHIFAVHVPEHWQKFLKTAGMSPSIAGFTYDNEFFYFSLDEEGRFDQKSRVQTHEMTHLLFQRFFRDYPPLWLNEGIAEYFGFRKTSTNMEFRRAMVQPMRFNLDTLFSATDYPSDPKAMQAFYAEAAVVVDFLTNTSARRALLPKFVDAMIADNNPNKAVKLYGYRDLADFKSAYERYRWQL
jgi:hypothetical protein